MIRRLSLCGALCTIFAAFAPAASAATYVGSAVDDPRTRVEFVKDAGKIRGFEVRRATLECFNGDAYRDGTTFGVMRLDSERRFAGQFMNGDETQAGRVKGRLRDNGSARGTLRITATFGEVTCTTRRVEWTARRE